MLFKTLALVIGLICFVVSAQPSLTVIEGLERFSEIASLQAGELLATRVLVCDDQALLQEVLESMQRQVSNLETLLSNDLMQKVNLHCWMNPMMDLQFASVSDDVSTLRQPLETDGFEQVSTVRRVEVLASGLAVSKLHSIGERTIAFTRTYTQSTFSAYFLIVEKIAIETMKP